MADPYNGNPFLEDREVPEFTPATEYDPPPEFALDVDDSTASVQPMDLERRTNFGASDWAHGAIPNQGLVDPGTIPQLVSGC